MSSKKDIVGQRFGRWTVLANAEPFKGRSMVLCRCDCGTERAVDKYNLIHGVSKSCGCAGADARRGTQIGEHIDLVGQRFGRLVAISFVKHDQWLWQCDCGKIKRIRASSVKKGITTSCGCLLSETARDKVENQNTLSFFDDTQICKLNAILSGKSKPRPGNSSGHLGVRARKYPNGRIRYQAQIMLRGKLHSLGVYDTIDEAVAARKDGERLYYQPVIDKYLNEQRRPDNV